METLAAQGLILVDGKVMLPADLVRLHKYMRDVEGVEFISDPMRAVVEELWPELAHKLCGIFDPLCPLWVISGT